MENKCYFIPKNLLQPDEYRLIFNSWNAVYKHSDSGKEYMIEVVPKNSSMPFGDVKHLEILTYNEEHSCRLTLGNAHKSYKSAVAFIENLLSQKEENKKSYNGLEISCPCCGTKITIVYDTARCEACGWMCADGELDDIMNP